MLRSVVRLALVVIIVVAAAAFFFGYRSGAPHDMLNRPAIDTSRPVATTGQTTAADRDDRVEHARETGAEVGEKVAVGAERASHALDDAGITAKVKSKILLDDTLKGSEVSVSTTDGVVSLGGSVANADQHQRAVSLARETSGVERVDDHLTVAGARQ